MKWYNTISFPQLHSTISSAISFPEVSDRALVGAMQLCTICYKLITEGTKATSALKVNGTPESRGSSGQLQQAVVTFGKHSILVVGSLDCVVNSLANPAEQIAINELTPHLHRCCSTSDLKIETRLLHARADEVQNFDPCLAQCHLHDISTL